ncbi:MAG: radical SAM/SPASM domain-containing protein, partial [Lachnospiraceae bacterium]
IRPCYFIDVSALKPGAEGESFYEKALPELAGEERAKALLPMLRRCVAAMKGRCTGAYQLGAMSGRGQDERLRFFTMEMTRQNLLSYLKELGWTGDVAKLDQLLLQFEPFALKKHFILDFDILGNGISRKIGINFGPDTRKKGAVREWLSYLTKEGLCLPSKEKDMIRWIERYPSHTPFMQQDISHFKFPFDGEKLLAAKAYLRQGSRMVNPAFRAYDTPILMNLELTTRCPLRCPQCYCELTGGKDMKPDTALYFLEEAAACHVQTVNLSGGETLCYPHLTRLVERCHALGMKPNIAVSGYGIHKEKLEELIRAGVHNICVSLNGSTEEINRKTRDGYELAMTTLSLLKEMNFPNTVINWVMHDNNADDFPSLVKLAEEYRVSEIAVMVFKPDASHQLPSMPSGEQMKKAAAFIKGYKGTVKIQAEECFSQMRALLGERFLINKNTGVSRGCGAGRDGISITVDGQITPCRHLEFGENNLSIRDYWNHSPVVQELRSVEEEMQEPCAACHYRRNCIPCMAVNVKLHDKIAMGMAECPLSDGR